MIDILVPVLDRVHRVEPLVESAAEATVVPYRLLFLCSEGDDAEIEAVKAIGADYVVEDFPHHGQYARKINLGVQVTQAPWIFQASDDLRFHRGWDEIALEVGERPAAHVIGTNDLGNPLVKSGRHSTHSLIRRTYITEQGTIDEPGKALHEGYWHCWVDNELIETAKSRGAYFAARKSVVEHLHPIWTLNRHTRERKGVDDATYQRGQARYREDQALFMRRRPLWRKR